MRIDRPVVRSFTRPHSRAPLIWVRAGGHAIVWIAPRKARLVFLDRRTATRATSAGGRPSISVAPATSSPEAVPSRASASSRSLTMLRDRARRAVRDAIHAARRARWTSTAWRAEPAAGTTASSSKSRPRALRAGRPGRPRARALARRDDGKVVLVLRRDKRCRHLGGRQSLRHLPRPTRRLRHLPRRKRVLPLLARRGARHHRRRSVALIRRHDPRRRERAAKTPRRQKKEFSGQISSLGVLAS